MPVADAVVVVGKDVSERGLGFYHPQPLAQRRMMRLDRNPQRRCAQAILIDISWCCSPNHGWCESRRRAVAGGGAAGPRPPAVGRCRAARTSVEILPPELAAELTPAAGLSAMAGGLGPVAIALR